MLNWADFYVCGDIFSLVCWVQKKESHSIDLFGCISVSVSVQPFAAEHDIPFFSLCLCCFLSNFTFSFTQHPLLFLQYSPFAIKAKKKRRSRCCTRSTKTVFFSSLKNNFSFNHIETVTVTEMKRCEADIRERKIRMANVTKWTDHNENKFKRNRTSFVHVSCYGFKVAETLTFKENDCHWWFDS